MLSKYILILFIFLNVTGIFAQSELREKFDKGTQYLKSENFKSAIASFSDVLKNASNDKLKKFCYIYRGQSYEGLMDYKKAIADFDMAILIDPNDIATFGDRAYAKLNSKDLSGAITDYEYIVSKDGSGKQAQGALYYLAKIYYQEKEFEKSISYYDKLIILKNNDPELYFNRGVAREMLMQPKEAILDYDKAIEIKPDYKEAYANRGVAKINLLTGKGGTIHPTQEQTSDACSDLKKAKELGDDAVDDMIFIYCNKK